MATDATVSRRSTQTRIRQMVPSRVRHRVLETRHRARMLTQQWRSLPDFLVIGTQRGGTTSLFRYLSAHPHLIRPLRKETGYFSGRYDHGIEWYRSHFPLRSRLSGGGEKRRLTFEATPDYLLDPRAARRAADTLPEVKLVALLRNPVERAYSHYRHMVRLGFEDLGFNQAIEAEEERCAGEWEHAVADRLARPTNLFRYSYCIRGHYAEHLAPWLERFGRDRILILVSERLFTDTAAVYGEILEFIGMEPWLPRSMPNHSPPPPTGSGPDPETTARLVEHFRPHNDRLRDLLSFDPGWGY